jgi:hypothetical protein
VGIVKLLGVGRDEDVVGQDGRAEHSVGGSDPGWGRPFGSGGVRNNPRVPWVLCGLHNPRTWAFLVDLGWFWHLRLSRFF